MKLNTISINEKREKAWSLAYKIGYIDNNGNTRALKNDDADLVHSILDFNYGYIDKILSGNCSLDAQLKFDCIEFEKQIDSDIIELKKLLIEYKID